MSSNNNNRNYTNFPNGFDDGVIIQDVQVQATAASNIFWVGNNPVLENGEYQASNSNRGTYFAPFSSIPFAISQCSTNNNNIIFVREGYTQTLTAAGDITFNVAGVTIIGLGQGANRPTLTFSTSTAASVVVSAANVNISGIVGVAGIDGLLNPFNVSGAGCTLDIEWQDGSSTVEATRAVLTSATADNFNLKLKYIGFPAGDAAVNAVRLVGCNNGKIDIDAYGIFSTAIVEFITTACTNMTVGGYFYNSGTTDATKNVVNTGGIASTGFVYLSDGAAGGIYEGGSATSWVLSAAEPSAADFNVPTADSTANATINDVVGNKTDAALADTIEGAAATTQSLDALSKGTLQRIGANNANNTGASNLVVANLDGTVLERLEALMDPLGGYDPMLGFRITKTSSMADGAGTDNLFTVTGRCLITHLSGEVTTQIGTTTTMKLTDTTNTVDLCAATTITTDVVGTMYALTPISANILNGTGATPVVGSIPNITGSGITGIRVVGDVQAPLTIAHVLDGAGTGAVAWVLYYKPLTAASSIVAAA